MYKWMYDRMVTEYSKESKEELIQRIMALEEIECSDRCFANQCMAGISIYNINELFSALEDTGCENYIYDGVTDEQFKWLEDKFSEVMEEFHKMANINPGWFTVTEIEEIDLNEYVKRH